MSTPPSDQPLELLAPEVLGELRRSFAEVIAAIGSPPETACELADRLGLEGTLGWKIWRTALGEGRYPSSKHIPGRPSVEAFLDAAVNRQVPPIVIDRARAAFGCYQDMIRKHAGDRATLDSMLSGVISETRDQSQERSIRRAGYRAASHAFGIHAKTGYDLMLVCPGQDGLLELAAVRGYFGVQRLRSDAPWLLQQTRFVDDKAKETQGATSRRTLGDSGDERSEFPMPIRAFSSDPLPEAEWVRVDPINHDCILMPGPIGKASAFDWVIGEHITGVERDTEEINTVSLTLRMPFERVCMDFLIHTELWDGELPDFRVYSALFGHNQTINNPYHIPVPETVIDLGPADRSPLAPEVPRHNELVRYVMDKLGQDLGSFRLFRVQMQFPPIPIILALLHELRPDEAGSLEGGGSGNTPF